MKKIILIFLVMLCFSACGNTDEKIETGNEVNMEDANYKEDAAEIEPLIKENTAEGNATERDGNVTKTVEYTENGYQIIIESMEGAVVYEADSGVK